MRRPTFWWGLALGISVMLTASPSRAQTPGNPDSSGNLTLASAQTTTGASSAAISAGLGYNSLLVNICNTTGSAEVVVEFSCDKGLTWDTVDDSTRALATECQHVDIVPPACGYRTNVTTCTSCTVTSKGHVGPRLNP